METNFPNSRTRPQTNRFEIMINLPKVLGNNSEGYKICKFKM